MVSKGDDSIPMHDASPSELVLASKSELVLAIDVNTVVFFNSQTELVLA